MKGGETVEQQDIDSSYKMSEVGFLEKAKNGLRNKSHGIDSDSVEIQEQSFKYLGGESDKYGGNNDVAIVEDGSVYTGEVEIYHNNDFDRLIKFSYVLFSFLVGVLSLLLIGSQDQEARDAGHKIATAFMLSFFVIILICSIYLYAAI